MATAHHDGRCTSCILCKKRNPKYTHPIQMKEKSSDTYKWLKDNYPHLEEAACICLPCFKQMSRNYNNPILYSNKNFILKYFRCRDGKRTETRIGMEGICITHSCIPLYTVYMQHIMAHSGGMQEWVIQIPSIPILVSVLFPSLHLKYFRIKFLLLVCLVFMRMRTKPHPHPV